MQSGEEPKLQHRLAVLVCQWAKIRSLTSMVAENCSSVEYFDHTPSTVPRETRRISAQVARQVRRA